jgi:hypothetical protein
MSVYQTKASLPVLPSVPGNLTASVSTVTDFDVTEWRGKFVTVQVSGGAVYLASGVASAAASVTAPATSGANIGFLIRDGEDKDFFIPEGNPGPDQKYWIRAISSGTATVTIVPTSR